MSKGSNRRPQNISDEEVEKSWERIFKKTLEVRKEDGKDESNTVKPKAFEREWLDNTSDS